jgi:hypothetical protein
MLRPCWHIYKERLGSHVSEQETAERTGLGDQHQPQDSAWEAAQGTG